VKLGPGAHINAPYSFVVGDTLIAAKDWAASPLNRTVGAERAIPPHALGGFYVEGRTPFKTIDGWLSTRGQSLRRLAGRVADAPGRLAGCAPHHPQSQGRPLESLSVLRMMQEATRGKISMARFDMARRCAGSMQYQRAGVTSQHVVGGTSRLTDAMAASLGDRVRLNRSVEAIDLNPKGCTVRCADGSRVRARFVIAAVPFTVLRRIAITPGAERRPGGCRRADALRQPEPGVAARAPARTGRSDGIEASMWTDGAFNLIRQQIESDGSRELISALAFSDKSVKLDAMPEAERGRFAIAEIERIRPSTRGLLEFVGAHSWEQAPWSRGCSFQMVPGRAHEWAQNMGKPHRRTALRRRAPAPARSRHGSRDGIGRAGRARDRGSAQHMSGSSIDTEAAYGLCVDCLLLGSAR
jgi:monoamine oxidase